MKSLMKFFLFVVPAIFPSFLLGDVTLSTVGIAPETVDVPTVVSSLIDHVHAQAIIDSAGKTRLELTDTVIEMIPYKGKYLLEGQAGFSGTSVPQPGESVFGHFVVSAFVRVDPYLKTQIHFPENYALLNALEFGPVYGYDFLEHHGYLGFQANLAFGLTPIK